MNRYQALFKSPLDIESFKFTKLLKEHIKIAAKGQQHQHNKLARSKAILEIYKALSRMDKTSIYYEEMMLEIEYIREVEKVRLRLNIMHTLNTTSAGGDYTLNEIGKVLGISRERSRQLEDAAVRLIKHPSIVAKVRDYL